MLPSPHSNIKASLQLSISVYRNKAKHPPPGLSKVSVSIASWCLFLSRETGMRADTCKGVEAPRASDHFKDLNGGAHGAGTAVALPQARIEYGNQAKHGE